MDPDSLMVVQSPTGMSREDPMVRTSHRDTLVSQIKESTQHKLQFLNPYKTGFSLLTGQGN